MLALLKILPIVLLIGLGVLLSRRNMLRPSTALDLKALVVNVTLPASLFLAFSGVDLKPQYLLIVAAVFSACLVTFWLARRLGPLVGMHSPYFPFLMTGFEAGMLGYAIFGAVYGQDAIFKFGLIDLGQVVFVFFVLVPALQRMEHGAQPFSQTLLAFLKTPVILAILGGIAFKAFGLAQALATQPLWVGLQSALQMLAGMTSPLVAFILGSEIRLQGSDLRSPVISLALRLAWWVPLGLLFTLLVVQRLLGLDRVFQAAVMTMVILPAPFVIPIFMQRASEEQRAYVVNMLSLGILATLAAFGVVTALFN